MKNSKYTYVIFAEEVKAIVEGKIEVTKEIAERVIEKANALIATQEKKKEYNATNPKKATAKGASEETKAKIALIAPILTVEPKTAEDINAELGTDFTALQVANAVKFIDDVVSVKVVRPKKNAKGLTQEREYTAYKK